MEDGRAKMQHEIHPLTSASSIIAGQPARELRYAIRRQNHNVAEPRPTSAKADGSGAGLMAVQTGYQPGNQRRLYLLTEIGGTVTDAGK